MSREEVQKLLGGYATGTLTEAEYRALLEAALDDQTLFDELAREQALREVLQEPVARRQLLAALEPRRRFFSWPAWVVAGSMAAALILAGVVLRRAANHPSPRAMFAILRHPAAVESAPEPVSPAPAAAPKVRPRVKAKPREPVPASSANPATAVGALASAPAPTPPPPPPAPTAVAPSSPQASGAFTALQAEAQQRAVAAGPVTKAALLSSPRYTWLLRGAEGEFVAASAGHIFHPGDSLRLQLEPDQDGYAYLFQRKLTGEWQLLADSLVESSQPAILPSRDALHFETAGRRNLLLVLAVGEDPQLAAADPSLLNDLARPYVFQFSRNVMKLDRLREIPADRPPLPSPAAPARRRTAVVIPLDFR